MAGKRRFGRVRRLPSGRWQARYKGPDGIDRPARGTFASKTGHENIVVGVCLVSGREVMRLRRHAASAQYCR